MSPPAPSVSAAPRAVDRVDGVAPLEAETPRPPGSTQPARPVLIASIMRPTGETGVRAHMRALLSAVAIGRPDDGADAWPAVPVVSPFAAPWRVGMPLGAQALIEPFFPCLAVAGIAPVMAPCCALCSPGGLPMAPHAPSTPIARYRPRRHSPPAPARGRKSSLRCTSMCRRPMNGRGAGASPVAGETSSRSAPSMPVSSRSERWSRTKNQAARLEIIACAHRASTPLTLTMVGEGPDRTMLEARAAELGITGAVRFAGYVADTARLLARHAPGRVAREPVDFLERA